jgi:penicillin amidase
MAGLTMSASFRNEVSRAELIAAVGLENARRLAPADPPHAYGPAPGVDLDAIDRRILVGYTAATRPLAFPPESGGSNNWVVDGTRSASGKPLLANDPHRALNLPALRYLVHLSAPGWHVIGAGEPALPGVAIGHNERIAWGMTIVGTDQGDLYVEETDPDDPTRYKVGERWEKMHVVRETIAVRGGDPVGVELRSTRHGPVLYQDARRHRAYALRWAGHEPGTAGYLGCLALNRAGNWGEFLQACRAWKLPGENLVYADVDGNIGWVAAALTPVRKGWDGLLPVPGASGKYAWQGFLEVADLPQEFNPPRHVIATANYNILPPGYTKHLTYEWAAPYRQRRVRAQLEEQRRWTVADFQRLQHDNVSLPGRLLARLAKRVKPGGPVQQRHLDLLTGWDGTLTADSKAGLLYGLWLNELVKAYARRHVPERLVEFVSTRNGLAAILAALERPDEATFGPQPEAARDRLLSETFSLAVRLAWRLVPGGEGAWAWGRLHTATFRHPLASRGPAFAAAFNLGPVPTPGDANTPNAASTDPRLRHTAGASFRQIFDLADWDRGVATSTPGQSGQPGSSHYGDLLPLWAKGEYFPLAFSRARVEEVTRHRLLLRPVP